MITIAVAIRIYRLLSTGPLSFDEAWSFWGGSKSLLQLLAITATDKHPPLFYLLLHFWDKFYYSELWVRIPSFIASLVNVWLFYKIAVLLIKNRSYVLLALALFVIDDMQLWYASIARSYELTSSLVLASTYVFLLLIRKPKSGYIKGHLLINIGLVLFSYLGWIVVLIQGVTIFVLSSRRDEKFSKVYRKWLKATLFLLVPLALIIPLLISQIKRGGFAPKWIALMVGEPGMVKLFSQITGLDYHLFGLSGYALVTSQVVIFVIVFLSVIKAWRSYRKIELFSAEVIYLTMIFLIPIIFLWVLSQIEPVFVKRYFMMVFFAYYVLIGYFLWRASWPNWLVMAISVFLLTGFAGASYAHLESGKNWEPDWHQIGKIIRDNWQEDDVLLVLPFPDLVRAKFYLKDLVRYKVDRQLYRHIFRSKRRATTTAALDSAFADSVFPYKRVWLYEVLDTGLSAEFYLQKQGFIYNYLKQRFKEDKINRYIGTHARLVLFYVKSKKDSL